MTLIKNASTSWIFRFSSMLFLSLLLAFPAYSQSDTAAMPITKWLRLGTFAVRPPAFQAQENLDGDSFKNSDLLSFQQFDIQTLVPQADAEVIWKADTFAWEELKTSKDDFVKVDKKAQSDLNELAYVATYLHADRWLQAELVVNSHQMLEIYLDNKKICTKKSQETKDEDPGSQSKQICLEKGKHLLLIKALKPIDNDADWSIKASLKTDKDFPGSSISADLSPETNMNIQQLLDGKFVSGASISPDGELALLNFSETRPPDGKQSRWAEVRNLKSGLLIQTFRYAEVSGLKWLPVGKALSYKTYTDGGGSNIWVFDFNNMTQTKVLSKWKDFGGYTWSPDASYFIFTVSEKPDDKEQDLKRYEGMPDRWPWWRSRSFLYKHDVQSGFTQRLTYGHLSTNLADIRPDGKKILINQSQPDFSQRPYSQQYLMEMDLETFKVDTIWEKNHGGSVSYTPDGEKLLVTGSPLVFGKTGVNVTGDVIPNDYDTQAYIYDLASTDVDPITFNFNPSIQRAVWSKYDDNKILFLVSDRTYNKIFSYDLNTRYFTEIPTGFDVVKSMSLSENLPIVLCTGSGISTPAYAAAIDISTGDIQTIANPRAKTYEHVAFGNTEDWNFTNRNGVTIEGRVYYPPNFDPKKKYPLIVYYYSGTSPTNRTFGGRYPKNLFASHGYIVYNLQPSGATGYGQDFSAAHVNNWGITVADEIIDGTKQFLDAHNFIDGEKVGCIGASYGGFMTMLLQTRTDIFAAAISHAGISSISSYWGEGYWGYLYSSVASANSFPWNNKNMYIEQSALFNADKINTPLLLLHGGKDTNVPPGESIQLYTALKLLGRPVELIEIKGQDHHIVDYKKRIAWQKTIFSWFDKWLKDQPQWWEELYPERNL